MLLQATNQNEMPQNFNQLQETKADKFALLLRLPENLIVKYEWYESIDLMTHFNVTEKIAIKRDRDALKSSSCIFRRDKYEIIPNG